MPSTVIKIRAPIKETQRTAGGGWFPAADTAGTCFVVCSGILNYKEGEMLNLDGALEKYGLSMPEPPAKGGIYEPVKEFGENFCYLSGCGPLINGKQLYRGKLGAEYTVEEGQAAARYCVLNLLANLKARIGDLDRVRRIVKMLCFVAGTDTFYEHPQVANGGSQLLEDIFGLERGRCARSAVGMNALPGNIPVEIELLVELT
jgi:enamine deaminase RidA (YjgF/YER057c/UK114 family)